MNNKKEVLIGEKVKKYVETVSKRQFTKKDWIIVSVVFSFVLLISIIAFFIFSNNNIIGSWSKSSGEGMSYILTFKDNDCLIVSKDSVCFNGTYKLKENNIISFDVSVNSKSFMSGDYQYRVISNFSDKKLELIDDKGNKEEYNQCQLTGHEGVKDFSVNSSLLGRWKNDEFGIEYEFCNDGLATVKKENMTVTFNYDVVDKTIVLKSKLSGSDQENKIEYTIEGNVLKIYGVDYIKQ